MSTTLRVMSVRNLPVIVVLSLSVWSGGVILAADQAPSIDGHWEGALNVQGMALAIAVDFETGDAGLAATIDIPPQGAFGLPLKDVRFEAPAVHFEIGGVGAVFDGELAAGKIAGKFAQSGVTGTFELARPQPQAPAMEAGRPFVEEEVRFRNGEIALAGTLTLPREGDPRPAIVLISGSGAQNRDENILGFEIFKRIAEHLTAQGLVVLRYDDRGVGGSTGDLSTSTMEDFSEDVLAALSYLAGRPEIDTGSIGLLGHSEGSAVAALAASRSEDVAFIVMMAGAGVSGEAINLFQVEEAVRKSGADEARVKTLLALQRQILAAVRTGERWDEVEATSREVIAADVHALPAKRKASLGDLDVYIDTVVQQTLQPARTRWFKSFIEYDPGRDLQEVTIPVLALFGGLDTQVPEQMNQKAVEAALEAAGNPNHATIVFPQANHLFQSAVTGEISEYATLDKEFTPGFLDAISDWILGL